MIQIIFFGYLWQRGWFVDYFRSSLLLLLEFQETRLKFSCFLNIFWYHLYLRLAKIMPYSNLWLLSRLRASHCGYLWIHTLCPAAVIVPTNYEIVPTNPQLWNCSLHTVAGTTKTPGLDAQYCALALHIVPTTPSFPEVAQPHQLRNPNTPAIGATP